MVKFRDLNQLEDKHFFFNQLLTEMEEREIMYRISFELRRSKNNISTFIYIEIIYFRILFNYFTLKYTLNSTLHQPTLSNICSYRIRGS